MIWRSGITIRSLSILGILFLAVAVACGTAAPESPAAAPTSAPPAAAQESVPPADTGSSSSETSSAPTAVVALPTPFPTAAPAPTAAPTGDQPNYGGTLNNTHRRWPPSFDSHAFGTSDVHSVAQPAFNGLIRGAHPRYTSIEGEMATSWDISSDGREFTFTLHPNIQTHNGQTLTADDVKWNFERMRDDESLEEAHASVGSEIDSVEVIDDTTVKVTLTGPSGVFVAKLSPPQMVMYDTQEFLDHNPTETDDMAGTGPFRLTEVVTNEVLRWERFENYFEEGKPYFDALNIFIIRDPATRLAALEAGELDILNVSNATGITVDMWQAAADRNPSVVWHRGVHFGGRGMIFNKHREGPWHDSRVRQAINLAVNRENAANIPAAVGPGGFLAPTGVWNIPLEELWDTAPGWRVGANKQQDIDEAVALLADAGYGPGELKIKALARDIADYSLYHGPFMVEEMRQIGIEVDLEIEESARFLERRRDRDYEILLDNTSGTDIDDPDFIVGRFLCDSGQNRSGHCNPEWDALALQQRAETDPAVRREIVRQMLDILWTDLWSIPVWWAGRHPGYRDWLVNPPILSASGQHVAAGRFQHSWFTRERIASE